MCVLCVFVVCVLCEGEPSLLGSSTEKAVTYHRFV